MSQCTKPNELNWRLCSKPVSRNRENISRDNLNWRNFSSPIVNPCFKKEDSKEKYQVEHFKHNYWVEQSKLVEKSSVLEHSKTESGICSEIIKLPDSLIPHSCNGKIYDKGEPIHYRNQIKYKCPHCNSVRPNRCAKRPHESCQDCKFLIYKSNNEILQKLNFNTKKPNDMFRWIISGKDGIGPNVILSKNKNVNLCHINAWLHIKDNAYIPGSNNFDMHAGPGPLVLFIKQVVNWGLKNNSQFKQLVKNNWEKRLEIIFQAFSEKSGKDLNVCKFPVYKTLPNYIVNFNETDMNKWIYKTEKLILGVTSYIRDNEDLLNSKDGIVSDIKKKQF